MEMSSEFSNLIIAKRFFDLISTDRQIGTRAHPGLNLLGEGSASQMIYQSLQTAELRVTECLRNKRWNGTALNLVQDAG